MRPPSYTSRRTLLNRFVAAGLGSAMPSAVLLRRSDADGAAPEGLSVPEASQEATVLDGDTVRLAAGGEVRLAGIEAAKASLSPKDASLMRLADAAAEHLRGLLRGGVILRYDRQRGDRYGRKLAQVFAADGTWLQAAQIDAGLARVHGDGVNRIGLSELLRREAAARSSRLGIWRDPAFAVRDAADVSLKRWAGSFQVVEGTVAAAATVRDAGYLNFGADRRTDFTLVVRKPVLGALDPAMVDLSRLAGRRIRCRGWIDLHDGPSMDLSCPEHLEVEA